MSVGGPHPQVRIAEAAQLGDPPDFSIVVLTFNRPVYARESVAELLQIESPRIEIILVDNGSDTPVIRDELSTDVRLRVVSIAVNTGTEGRNVGASYARAPLLLTLDDDISGLTGEGLRALSSVFRDTSIGAVCFKVVDPTRRRQINWCHPRAVERAGEMRFDTHEISEGAVAFRTELFRSVGGYPGRFFISHEGADLAWRLIGQGARVVYDPAVAVVHAEAKEARASWRRYYFDTRNSFWLAARNFPAAYGIRRTLRQVAAMGIYAARDGFIRHWWRGMRDGLTGLPSALRERTSPGPDTIRRIREIERGRPSLAYYVTRRLFRRRVSI